MRVSGDSPYSSKKLGNERFVSMADAVFFKSKAFAKCKFKMVTPDYVQTTVQKINTSVSFVVNQISIPLNYSEFRFWNNCQLFS